MDENNARVEKPTVELEQAAAALSPVEVTARERIRERAPQRRRTYASRTPQRSTYAHRRGRGQRGRQSVSFSAFNKERFVMQLMVSGILIVLVVVVVNIKSSFTADLQSDLKTAVSETTTLDSVTAFANAAKEKANGLFNSVGVIFGYQQEEATGGSIELPTKEYSKDNESDTAEAKDSAAEEPSVQVEEETGTAAQTETILYHDAIIDEETLNQINASAADEKND